MGAHSSKSLTHKDRILYILYSISRMGTGRHSNPFVSADGTVNAMAQRVKKATRTRHVQDHDADTDAPVPGSFPRYGHHRTDSISSHDSHDSNSMLADDEDSLAESPDEADGELCLSHSLSNNSYPAVVLEAPHIIAHPQHAKWYSSQSSDGENPNPWLRLDISLIYPVAGSHHDFECDQTRKQFPLHGVSKVY